MVGDQTRGEHRCCGREGKGGRGRSGEAPSEEEKTLTLTLTLEGPLASPFFWLPVGPRAQASLPHSCLCQHVAETPCCHFACTVVCGSICFHDQKAVGESEVPDCSSASHVCVCPLVCLCGACAIPSEATLTHCRQQMFLVFALSDDVVSARIHALVLRVMFA